MTSADELLDLIVTYATDGLRRRHGYDLLASATLRAASTPGTTGTPGPAGVSALVSLSRRLWDEETTFASWRTALFQAALIGTVEMQQALDEHWIAFANEVIDELHAVPVPPNPTHATRVAALIPPSSARTAIGVDLDGLMPRWAAAAAAASNSTNDDAVSVYADWATARRASATDILDTLAALIPATGQGGQDGQDTRDVRGLYELMEHLLAQPMPQTQQGAAHQWLDRFVRDGHDDLRHLEPDN